MFLYDRNIISSSSVRSRLSLETVNDLRKISEMFGNDCLAFGQLLENLRKSSGSVRKSSENHQKVIITVCLYNQQNNTWLLVDMEFL